MSSRYQWHESDGNDYNNWVLSNDHVQFLLDRLQTDPAGTFTYNSAAVSLLGLVLQSAVAEPLPDFADETLFQPIGISSVQWEELEPNMVNAGSGIKMTATDLLRFGQLLWWLAQPPATVAIFAWGHGGQSAYVVPSLDLVVVATTQWQGLSAETNATTFAGTVLTIIVNDILPAARN